MAVNAKNVNVSEGIEIQHENPKKEKGRHLKN
jgi:hypothetical protein